MFFNAIRLNRPFLGDRFITEAKSTKQVKEYQVTKNKSIAEDLFSISY